MHLCRAGPQGEACVCVRACVCVCVCEHACPQPQPPPCAHTHPPPPPPRAGARNWIVAVLRLCLVAFAGHASVATCETSLPIGRLAHGLNFCVVSGAESLLFSALGFQVRVALPPALPARARAGRSGPLPRPHAAGAPSPGLRRPPPLPPAACRPALASTCRCSWPAWGWRLRACPTCAPPATRGCSLACASDRGRRALSVPAAAMGDCRAAPRRPNHAPGAGLRSPPTPAPPARAQRAGPGAVRICAPQPAGCRHRPLLPPRLPAVGERRRARPASRHQVRCSVAAPTTPRCPNLFAPHFPQARRL